MQRDWLPSSTRRVESHTSSKVNRSIRRRIEVDVTYYARHRDQIDERLAELDREWDIERVLEVNAGAISVAAILLGRKSFLMRLMPLAVSGFLIQHATQGWCPPLPIFRRLGVRTPHEIALERYALKALRGDFAELGKNADENDPSASAEAALEAAEIHLASNGDGDAQRSSRSAGRQLTSRARRVRELRSEAKREEETAATSE